MAFKMNGNPFKKVATKSVKNSAYKQWEDPWKGGSKKPKEDMKDHSARKKDSSDPFKQWDDPWGTGSAERMATDRANPDSRTLKTSIFESGRGLDRLKARAEKSGSMKDWMAYNKELERMSGGLDSAMDYGYNTQVYGEDKTFRDSSRLQEGDIEYLEGHVAKAIEGHEAYSNPMFDEMAEIKKRGDAARESGDKEAMLQALADMKKAQVKAQLLAKEKSEQGGDSPVVDEETGSKDVV